MERRMPKPVTSKIMNKPTNKHIMAMSVVYNPESSGWKCQTRECKTGSVFLVSIYIIEYNGKE